MDRVHAAWVRSFTSSFCRIRSTCTFTVPGEIPSSAASVALVSPRGSSESTCFSRLLSALRRSSCTGLRRRVASGLAGSATIAGSNSANACSACTSSLPGAGRLSFQATHSMPWVVPSAWIGTLASRISAGRGGINQLASWLSPAALAPGGSARPRLASTCARGPRCASNAPCSRPSNSNTRPSTASQACSGVCACRSATAVSQSACQRALSEASRRSARRQSPALVGVSMFCL